MKSISFTPLRRQSYGASATAGSFPLPVCRLRAISSAAVRGIGIILLLFICATLIPAAIAGKKSLSNNGSVAQSVTPFQMPDHRLALAVAFAYSDSVGIFTQESPGAPFVISQMMETGMHPGLANDLPRHILAMDTNQDTITDLVVLSSGNPNIGTRGSVQVFEGRPDGTFIPHTAYPAEPNHSDVFLLPVTLAVAHLDGDMHPGLVVGYGSYPGVGIMECEEMGDFEFREIVDLNVGDAPPPPTGENTGAPAVLCPDLDGDGMADLVAGCGNFLFTARGTGNLHFMCLKKIVLPADCTITSLAVADFGRSSSLDIVAGVSGGYVYIFSGLSPDGVNCGPPLRINALGNMPSKGVSDVVIADWNRDSLADIIAVNRLDDCVSIISPMGMFNTTILPTHHLPRRCAALDANGDGVPDIVTANEGDLSIPGNPALSFLMNQHKDQDGFRLLPAGRIHLAEFFPQNIGIPSAAVFIPDRGLLVADVDAGKFWTLDRDGTLLASEPFPGSPAMKDISGLAWRISADSDILSLMIRQKASIFEVHDGAVINTIPIAEDITGGVSGLVYNEGAKEYWFLVPQQCELLILSLTGQLKKKLSLPAAYSKMAVDFETNTVYLSDSSCNQIDRYLKSENNLIRESPILLSHLSPLLCRSGVGALAWRQAEKNLAVCTTDHIYILIDAKYDAHIVAGPASLSRGRNIVSLSTEKSTGCLFALDLDAVPAVISLDGKNHHASVFSLEDFLTQNSFFRPGAIAFDTRRNLGGEILVADRAESGFAVFDRNGNFISFQAWTTQGENSLIGSSIEKPDVDENRRENSFIGQPITGLDIDENTGDILIRSRHGLIWTNRQGMNRCFSSVDGSDPGGVSAGADAIYTLAPNGRRIDRMKTDGRPGGSAFLVGLSSNDAPSGLASNPDLRLLYVGLATSGDTIIYNEEKITSADSSWNSYE